MISVSNVSKTYGRFRGLTRALDGVSLEVSRGETLGLIGPNGAGKTTLLSCLLGFLRPDTGTISVDGKAVDDLSIRARTGYMPERLGFDRDLSGGAFLAHHWRLSGATGCAGGAAAADRVGPEACCRGACTYSRGMLQRLRSPRPPWESDFLFLDEPARADRSASRRTRPDLEAVARRHDRRTLTSSRVRVCDRIASSTGAA
jgi:ABC-2 type transport system ATP-binding protein